MNVIIVIVGIFLALGAILGGVAYLTYRGKLRRAKAIERGLKTVPLLIHLPPSSEDTAGGSRDVREVMREKTAQAEVLYNLISGTATQGFKSTFYGQRHIALELVATNGLVHYYAAVPVALVSTVQKAILTAYPGSRIEEVEDHNIFNQDGRLAATMGGELVLKSDSAYPIATYESLERDPMEAIITTLSGLGKEDGAAIQIMVRPTPAGWTKHATGVTDKLRKGRNKGLKITPMDLAKAAVVAPKTDIHDGSTARKGEPVQLSNLELATIEKIEDKTKHPTFEVLVRVVVSTQTVATSQQLLRDIATTFALYEAPGLNGFKFLPAQEVQGLVTAFIFRFFPPEAHGSVLNSVELATLFHLPDAQFTPTTSVERQMSKEVDGPASMPSEGLLFGYNEFRGVRKEIRLSEDDRRRHTYILGQTGTGKSVMLENLAVQDMKAGRGFAFIDPHGETAEKLLGLIPKERAEDVIYFNPADMDFPLGLNLFEFTDPTQKDFLVQESINMLYKLYDPGKTGIIGPRFEHWFRNAALTLMSDPNGATFIEIPKVFTDTEYLKQKFKYLKDPTVIEFWTKEMAQTSDYHKSEMLGWFVSKFGAYLNNETMRNILGQTKSSFNLREIMDKKKILIVNLSKGRLGELNSNLLGMIFVIKFQAAAMSRADMDTELRNDFSLYVDEFQNFSTDSFATILSEARKYRLNLIVANQFIGQLSPEIRDAIFGNVGTMVAHRMGPEDAEFMVKQLAPVFDASDLTGMPNLHSAVRMLIGGLPSQPFSMADLPWVEGVSTELAAAIKQLSAAKFGHSRNDVEADLQLRLTGKAADAPLPPTPVAVAEPPVAAAPEPAALPQNPAPAPSAPVVVSAPEVPVVQPAPEPKPPVTVFEPAPEMPAALQYAPPLTQPPAEPIAPQPTAPAPAPAPAADLLRLASTPPPIGAPPIDLGPDPASVKDPSSLSVSDITGGKPLPTAQPIVDESVLRRQQALEESTIANDPLGGVPLLAVAPPVAAQAAEASDELLRAADPLTSVPLLGSPVPEVKTDERTVITEPPADNAKPSQESSASIPIEAPMKAESAPQTKATEVETPKVPGSQSEPSVEPSQLSNQPVQDIAIQTNSDAEQPSDKVAADTARTETAQEFPEELPESEIQKPVVSEPVIDETPSAPIGVAEEADPNEPDVNTQDAMAGTGGYIHFVDPKLEEVLEEPSDQLRQPAEANKPQTDSLPVQATAEIPKPESVPAEDSSGKISDMSVTVAEPEVAAEPTQGPVASIPPPSEPQAQTADIAGPIEPVVAERSTDEVLAAVMAAAAKRRQEALDDVPSTPQSVDKDKISLGTTLPPAQVPENAIAIETPSSVSPTEAPTTQDDTALDPDDAIRRTEHRIDELLSASLLDNNDTTRTLPMISQPQPDPEPQSTVEPELESRLESKSQPQAEIMTMPALASEVAALENAAPASTASSTIPAGDPQGVAESDDDKIVFHPTETHFVEGSGAVVTGTQGERERLPEPAPAEIGATSEFGAEDEPEVTSNEPKTEPQTESHQKVIMPLEPIPGNVPPALLDLSPEVAVEPAESEAPVIAMPEEEYYLPEAESLAAPDVAAANQARAAQAEVIPPEPEAEVSIAIEPAESEPIDEPRPEQTVLTPPTSELSKDMVADPKEVPSGLILPTQPKANNLPSRPVVGSLKPDNLSKGEVYVDELGNVVIGE